MATLATQHSQDPAHVEDLAAKMLSGRRLKARRLMGGGNSRIFVLDEAGKPQYVMKFYFRHPQDPRDRLKTEFEAFLFLWQQGIKDVPQPIAMDLTECCAVYEFIEGEKIIGDGRTADIETAVDFARRLKDAGGAGLSAPIGLASEANFSIQDITSSLERRLLRLREFEAAGAEYEDLKILLKQDLAPFTETLKDWARQDSGQAYSQEIPQAQRTLSPSDFGFHNCLRQAGGRLVFLDFEYFGWDDPAKMTVDFILHPAMNLREDAKHQYVSGLLKVFADNPALPDRVAVVYPLYAVKWCLIFLNEFVPKDFSRRAFASADPLQAAEVRMQKLAKAKNLLGQIRQTYQECPYVVR